ncbi:hypothetical protein [Psychrosphaera aestuarii]|uniref:hypothetical protein n=1 Tax=Psychrosphaera aestuarii TaxID=1266052 RepID=UPI001B3369EC|nr:hypothetical protein [Psychrosphaera aestuarii]
MLQEKLEQAVINPNVLSKKLTLEQYFNIISRFYISYIQIEKRLIRLERQVNVLPASPYNSRLSQLEAELLNISSLLDCNLPIPAPNFIALGLGSKEQQYWGIRYALDSFSQTAKMLFPLMELTIGKKYSVELSFWKKLCHLERDWLKTLTAIDTLSILDIERSVLITSAQETYILISENMAGLKPGH